MIVSVGDEARYLGQRVEVLKVGPCGIEHVAWVIFMTGSCAGEVFPVHRDDLEPLDATARPSFQPPSQPEVSFNSEPGPAAVSPDGCHRLPAAVPPGRDRGFTSREYRAGMVVTFEGRRWEIDAVEFWRHDQKLHLRELDGAGRVRTREEWARNVEVGTASEGVGDSAVEESGWLVELPYDPRYGRESWYSGAHGFTIDSLQAIRYARKEDALREIYRLPYKLAPELVATEHRWIGGRQ